MNNSLSHYGIKGQKWGERRYQNADGTLTPEGKERYNIESERKNTVRHHVSNFSGAKKDDSTLVKTLKVTSNLAGEVGKIASIPVGFVNAPLGLGLSFISSLPHAITSTPNINSKYHESIGKSFVKSWIFDGDVSKIRQYHKNRKSGKDPVNSYLISRFS